MDREPFTSPLQAMQWARDRASPPKETMMTSNAAFKKQVRELAEKEDIPYAEARSRLLGAKLPDSNTEHADAVSLSAAPPLDAIAQVIGRAMVTRALELTAADRKQEATLDAWADAREREGLRVVMTQDKNGEPFDTHGTEVRDYRTGETLATGLRVRNELNQKNGWINISEGYSDRSLGELGYFETDAFAVLPDDAAPELETFLGHLLVAMDLQPWTDDFAEWLDTQAPR